MTRRDEEVVQQAEVYRLPLRRMPVVQEPGLGFEASVDFVQEEELVPAVPHSPARSDRSDVTDPSSWEPEDQSHQGITPFNVQEYQQHLRRQPSCHDELGISRQIVSGIPDHDQFPDAEDSNGDNFTELVLNGARRSLERQISEVPPAAATSPPEQPLPSAIGDSGIGTSEMSMEILPGAQSSLLAQSSQIHAQDDILARTEDRRRRRSVSLDENAPPAKRST